MPPVPSLVGPPTAGNGQVTFAADEPAIVEEITGHVEGVTSGGRFVSGLSYQTACPQTPCVANLPLGPHDLRITSLSDPTHVGMGSIIVGPQPTDYRYALGHNIYPEVVGGALALSAGICGLFVGPVFIAVGNTGNNGPNFTPYGYGALIGGLALTALGAILIANGRGTTQDGTGLQWTPSGPP